MNKYKSFFFNNELFKCFSEEDFRSNFGKSNSYIKRYTKNSVIYIQNEICNSLDIILQGTVAIQKINSEGKVLTINDFNSGDTIGGNLLFSSHNKYPMTVLAKKDVRILHIKKEIVLKLCQTNECFLLAFLNSLSDKTLLLSDKIKHLTMKTLRQCIIEFLLYEYHTQESTKIKLNTTKKDLAEKMGVQRSSLSRELNKMRKDGLIDYDAKYITINDIDLLNQLYISN
ncbi:MAG: Crp/Fnr family transcriptional regulator [Tissierellia bacterium]|nr:Crp/Fnr family transcriptional regulator [Tissierellia bacterium]